MIKTPNIAIIIAKAVNKPNKIVGIKFDKHKTENPKAIVNEVVNTACQTVLCEFSKDSSIGIFLLILSRVLYK